METGYAWDLIRPELARLFLEPWGEPILGPSNRQRVATLFAMRALRRIEAINVLFEGGYYWECHSIVRNAYEDWLQLAYLLREPGDTRCDEFAAGIYKHDARVHDAFASLCGSDVARTFFGDLPAEVERYSGLPRSATQAMSFATMADDVVLRPIHDFAYTYLSGRCHPDGRLSELFDDGESVVVARIPARNPAEEERLALWFSWFTARVLVLASREFGVDREPFCAEFLLPVLESGDSNLETCVFVREYGDP